jgi:uncharacterized protein YoxC
MPRFYFIRPLTVACIALIGVRLCIIALGAVMLCPVLVSAQGSAADARQDAEITAQVARLEAQSKRADDVQGQVERLQERVSRIEGIGIGLSALAAVQLFLQLNEHVTVRRKTRKGGE